MYTFVSLLFPFDVQMKQQRGYSPFVAMAILNGSLIESAVAHPSNVPY